MASRSVIKKRLINKHKKYHNKPSKIAQKSSKKTAQNRLQIGYEAALNADAVLDLKRSLSGGPGPGKGQAGYDDSGVLRHPELI